MLTDVITFLNQYKEDIKLLVRHPGLFYAERVPVTDYRFMVLNSLPPILVFAAITAFLDKKLVALPIHALEAYVGLLLVGIPLKYGLAFFNEKRSFLEVFDLLCTCSPGFLIAWIPTYGLPALCSLIGFWLYNGFYQQFKMDKNAAMAAVTLPIVLTLLAGGFIALYGTGLTYLGDILHHGAVDKV